MIEKIDKIRELLIVPSVDEQPKLSINQMKILNLLVELRVEAEQLNTPAVLGQSEQFYCEMSDKTECRQTRVQCQECKKFEETWKQ